MTTIRTQIELSRTGEFEEALQEFGLGHLTTSTEGDFWATFTLKSDNEAHAELFEQLSDNLLQD